MEKSKIDDYVLNQINAGVEPHVMKQNLIMVGWSEADAKAILSKALIASGIPSPISDVRVGGKISSTVEVVLNFFSFILLAIVATAFGTLYYQIINYFFPDPLTISYGSSFDASRSAMHYAMSALFIGFPMYVFAVHIWFKRFTIDDDKVESKLSKWLTYLVLLIAAVTIVGDLITSMFYLLQGEITARFFFKALTILVTAGVVFGFYFFERKSIQYRQLINPKIFRNFAGLVGVLVVVGIILGFVVGGSPATERLRGLDQQRADNLSNIANCVSNFGRDHKRLPTTLEEMTTSSNYAYCATNIVDPVTRELYAYSVVTASQQNGVVREGVFELCADFALSTSDDKTLPVNAYASPNTKWMIHGMGRSCDAETVVLQNDLNAAIREGAITEIPVPM